MRALSFGVLLLWLASCAGPNPNPGERSADVAIQKEDYAAALPFLLPAAQRGEPWAQLRLGILYEFGSGVPQDMATAVKWYELAAAQEAEGDWANGQLVGANGPAGYFNQTSDALIAKHQLANIFMRGEGVPRDLDRAHTLALEVVQKTDGKNLFYCCEFSGGHYITAEEIAETLHNVEAALNE